MYRTYAQLIPMLPASASASVVAAIVGTPTSIMKNPRTLLVDRASTTPLLAFVQTKALYKATEITVNIAGPIATIDLAKYRSGDPKALILHAARLSQSMHNASVRARVHFASSPRHVIPLSRPPSSSPCTTIQATHRRQSINPAVATSNPLQVLLGSTVYFSRTGRGGHILAKNGGGSVLLPPSGVCRVKKRAIHNEEEKSGGGRMAVVLKDTQGNVIKVSNTIGLWRRARWKWLMRLLAEHSQEPDVVL